MYGGFFSMVYDYHFGAKLFFRDLWNMIYRNTMEIIIKIEF